jgi:hypothetical protein
LKINQIFLSLALIIILLGSLGLIKFANNISAAMINGFVIGMGFVALVNWIQESRKK